MVPSMIEALLETPQGIPIKYLISGGEKITDNVCLIFFKKLIEKNSFNNNTVA